VVFTFTGLRGLFVAFWWRLFGSRHGVLRPSETSASSPTRVHSAGTGPPWAATTVFTLVVPGSIELGRNLPNPRPAIARAPVVQDQGSQIADQMAANVKQ
jgi:hypothetical protein